MDLPAHQLTMTVLMTPESTRRCDAAKLRKALRREFNERMDAVRGTPA